MKYIGKKKLSFLPGIIILMISMFIIQNFFFYKYKHQISREKELNYLKSEEAKEESQSLTFYTSSNDPENYPEENEIQPLALHSLNNSVDANDWKAHFPNTSQNTFLTKEEHVDIWNCVSVNMGCNITPSLKYKFQYFRLISSVFLHDSIFHLIFNILFIVLYFPKKNNTSFQFFSTILILNLISALKFPNNVKIGSSGFALFCFGQELLRKLFTSKIEAIGKFLNFQTFCVFFWC